LLDLRQRLRLALEPVATQAPSEPVAPGPDEADAEDPPPASKEGVAEPKAQDEKALRDTNAPASNARHRR